jgi:hypothetical protein
VWVDGDNARYWLHTSSGLMPKMTLSLIGSKSDLEKLGYNTNDVDTFIHNIDTASKIAPKDLDKIVKGTAAKAKDKAKK